MTTRTQNVRSAPVILAVVGALALSACEDRPIVDVSAEQDGRPVLKTVVGVGALTFPSADIEIGEGVVVAFDPTVDDAFARATGESYALFDCGGDACWIWDATDLLDGASTDDRAPAPTAGSVAFGSYAGDVVLAMFEPNGNAVADTWNWFGSFTGLAASQRHWVGLARMGVTVNGEIDQQEILTGSAVTTDALDYVGGAPGGDGTRGADLFNDGRDGRPGPYPAEPGANPFVLGFSDADASGELVIDFVFSSQDGAGDDVYYTTGDAVDPTASPVGPNDLDTGFGDDQYNYIVVWDDDPLTNPNANVVYRIQIGADLVADGSAVANNGFAPFPQEKLDVPVADSLSLPGTTGGPATIVMNASDFPILATGAAFQIKAWRRDTGEFSGPIPLEITDPLGNVTPGNTFNGFGAGASFSVEAIPTAIDFLDFSHLVVSHDGAQDSEFLHGEYTDDTGAFTFGDMTFGGFDSEDETQTYAVAGSGLGEFFGDSLFVRLSRVTPRTLKGFHYQSYLLSSADGVAPLRLHAMDLDALGNGTDRIGEDEVQGGFGNYNFWVLALEPDGKTLAKNGVANLQIQVTEDYFGKFPSFFSR